MYIHIYTYTHTYKNIHVHIHIYAYIHTCIHHHVHTHIYTYVCVCINTSIYMYMYIYAYIYTHIHTYVDIYTYIHSRTYLQKSSGEACQQIMSHVRIHIYRWKQRYPEWPLKAWLRSRFKVAPSVSRILQHSDRYAHVCCCHPPPLPLQCSVVLFQKKFVPRRRHQRDPCEF